MVSLSLHISVLLAFFTALANAHFQLQFPPPRGPFVEDNEPTFCDGYNSVANRTQFPLSGGFFSLNSEHPKWTIGVLISTVANPTSFDNFTLVNTFSQLNGEGGFCLPLDFSTSNVTGLQNGENVTVQMVFNGGDGQLYQCSDLTLESNFSISSSVPCTNATANATTSFGMPTMTAHNSLAGAFVGLIILALMIVH
ncbi:hypothetical protein BYT27DRAFT_7189274 [Phlegmacium glaucopus]|nr:hypothetical protein BYT27DRAFT_7189274 [Phlegmacium glaucopus]